MSETRGDDVIRPRSMTIAVDNGVFALGELAERVDELLKAFGPDAEVRVRTKLGAKGSAGSLVRSITASSR